MTFLPVLTSSILLILAGELPAPSGIAIVDPETKLEWLFTRTAKISGGLTEGPTAALDGSIYFSDIPFGADQGMILRFDPKTKKTTVFAEDSGKSNGLKVDSHGNLIACEGADFGRRRLARWDLKTGKSETIVAKYQGKRFNSPNDLCIDHKGRIYFTDPRYVGSEPRELKHQAVYRASPDGSVLEITHQIAKPNGIVLSPDQKTLYVVENDNGTDKIDPKAPTPKKGAMKIHACKLDADGLVVGDPKTFIDFGTEDGTDGVTVDVKGNLYLAVRSLKRPGIWVLDPTGKEIAYIPTGAAQPGAKSPVGIPSNCTFGRGSESSTLYITVDTSLYRIALKVPGYQLPRARETD